MNKLFFFIIFFLLLFSVSGLAVLSKYQEFANEGGYVMYSGGNASLESNYTKPVGFINATWQVRHGTGDPSYNITLPFSCLNQSKLILRIRQFYDGGENVMKSQPQCYNSSDWVDVGTLVAFGGGALTCPSNGSNMLDGDYSTFACAGACGGWIISEGGGSCVYEEGIFWSYENSLPSAPNLTTVLGNRVTNNTPLIEWVKGNDSDNDSLQTYLYLSTSANFNNCYQETANVSTNCGGLNSGSYEFTNTSSNGFFYVNYSKPFYSNSSSVWNVKFGDVPYLENETVPFDCWNFNDSRLSFRFYSRNILSPGISYGMCYNGTSWKNITSIASINTGLGGWSSVDARNNVFDGNWNSYAGWDSAVTFNWTSDFTGSPFGSAIYEEAMTWSIDNLTHVYNTSLNYSMIGVDFPLLDGVNYFVRLRSWDGFNFSENFSNVMNFTMNTKPTVSSIFLTPSPFYTTDSAVCNVVGSDNDSDTVSFNYSWFANSVLIIGAVSNSLVLGIYAENTNITCQAVPFDGYEYGVGVNVSALISHSPPGGGSSSSGGGGGGSSVIQQGAGNESFFVITTDSGAKEPVLLISIGQVKSQKMLVVNKRSTSITLSTLCQGDFCPNVQFSKNSLSIDGGGQEFFDVVMMLPENAKYGTDYVFDVLVKDSEGRNDKVRVTLTASKVGEFMAKFDLLVKPGDPGYLFTASKSFYVPKVLLYFLSIALFVGTLGAIKSKTKDTAVWNPFSVFILSLAFTVFIVLFI